MSRSVRSQSSSVACGAGRSLTLQAGSGPSNVGRPRVLSIAPAITWATPSGPPATRNRLAIDTMRITGHRERRDRGRPDMTGSSRPLLGGDRPEVPAVDCGFSLNRRGSGGWLRRPARGPSQAPSSARVRSAIRSSGSSIPTDSRTSASVDLERRSGDRCVGHHRRHLDERLHAAQRLREREQRVASQIATARSRAVRRPPAGAGRTTPSRRPAAHLAERERGPGWACGPSASPG